MSGLRRWSRRLARPAAYAVAFATALLLLGGVLIRTEWAHARMRTLAIAQANRWLDGTLDIGRIDGSLLHGVELHDVTLTANGERIIEVERVSVSYGLGELFGDGTRIQRIVLEKPRLVASQGADGRWNFTRLLRPRETPARGNGRRISLASIEVHDGAVSWRTPMTVGAVHVPTEMTHIEAVMSVDTAPGAWTIGMSRLSMAGASPDLALHRVEGAIDGGDTGLAFRALRVVTDRSEVVADGRIVPRDDGPSALDITAHAARFDFQEWSGVLTGMSNIAVRAAFDLRLAGPQQALATSVTLRSTGGDIAAELTLDSTRPALHASGHADVARLNLAAWLNQPGRPSDITGRLDVELDLITPRNIPRGAFSFAGSHVAYLEYQADDVSARGRVTNDAVQIDVATATAYAANLRLGSSTIALDEPYGFHFRGHAVGVDLRQVPASVPVPRVESTLAFEFDTVGQFAAPFITGRARFGDSLFLGATLADGATGSIDTQASPLQYAGEGTLRDVDLNRFGQALSLAWLADPRYDGRLAGHFVVQGAGTDPSSMTLTSNGHVTDADLFGGHLENGEVSAAIAGGSLEASYDGGLRDVDPAIAIGDARYTSHVTGRGRGHLRVRDLLVTSPVLSDYTLDASLALDASTVRDLAVDRGTADVSLAEGTLHLTQVAVEGPSMSGNASGVLELDGVRSSRVDYDLRGDLERLAHWVGDDRHGAVATRGQLTGPLDRLHATGTATVQRLASSGVEVSTGAVQYDVTVDPSRPQSASGRASGVFSDIAVNGQAVRSLTGDVRYDAGRVLAGVTATRDDSVAIRMDADARLDPAEHRAEFSVLTLATSTLSWQLAAATRPVISWTENGVRVDALDLVDSSSRQQHLTAAGNWDSRGGGQMRLTARSVSIDSLAGALGATVPYAGLLNGTAVVSVTRAEPRVAADFVVSDGRLQRLSYERFGGHIEYMGGMVRLDVRLDQSPGAWLTAIGDVPTPTHAGAPADLSARLAVRSSSIDLALLEGLTDVVSDVRGRAEIDVTVLGTTSDPHFSGHVAIAGASFAVRNTGSRYKNARASVQLTEDRVAVDSLHVEDADGHALDVTGSLGTHELRVGDLRIDVVARGFQLLRNEYGRVAVDARMNLSGEFESPRLTGRVTVTGGSIAVDRVLQRVLFQPYATTASSALPLDAISALNPWERLGMDVELHVPGTLRMSGDNVQVSPGTPLGLGDINLKVFGDLYLYKDPAQPMYVNGSLDSLTGTYAFQGRRFELDPDSSVFFRGDLNPDLYITVRRIISGVETRVSILGPLAQPELRLASTPPLDSSDILSLIVFNTSTNQLSAPQQQQLAVRAGTLAAGFIAAPMVSALERTLGLDTLEIEAAGDGGSGPRVTVGDEIAPGLVARFSRQFGSSDYDEATLEYYLSRIFRLRATFSDASSLTVSPFRRVERAGIDLLLLFSF